MLAAIQAQKAALMAQLGAAPAPARKLTQPQDPAGRTEDGLTPEAEDGPAAAAADTQAPKLMAWDSVQPAG